MTTILIGLAPGDRGEAASHLGAMIARSTDSPLVVAAITPVPWPPSPFLGDEEYLALQRVLRGGPPVSYTHLTLPTILLV